MAQNDHLNTLYVTEKPFSCFARGVFLGSFRGWKMRTVSLVLLLGFYANVALATQPIKELTPGKLCTQSDPNFKEIRYPANVPVCERNVSEEEKALIAKNYGVPKADWPKYEFDHLIPLNAGGSDDISNIWPQPLAEAHLKDVVEEQTFEGLSQGTLTQNQAVQMIWDWIDSHP